MTNQDITNVANNILGSIHKRIEFIDAQLEEPDERADAQDLCHLESLAASLKNDAELLENVIMAVRRAQ
jgi:hypothetical protein